jgi:hypothetical protein
MLSDQSILKGFVYDALEALRDVENRPYENEKVHGYADARYKSPAAVISDHQPAAVNVIALIFEEASEMPLEQNQEYDIDENIGIASTSRMLQDSSHESLPDLVQSSSSEESNESADDDDDAGAPAPSKGGANGSEGIENLSHGKML